MSGPKSKAQKAAKKAAKQKKKGKSNSKNKGSQKMGPMTAPPRNVASAVTDGVNVGMVWRNSNQVRDHFQRRFEKVTDIAPGSTAFSIIQSFFLNPGNSVLFPVFSQIASTYEEYICHLLRFWYRGEEYMASGTNVSAGIVAMVTNMDPDDSQFTNINQLENYEGSVSGPPFSGHFVHDVAVAHKSRGRNRQKGDALSLNQYFVFSSANVSAPTGQQAKFFDMGQFQVAVNGCQAATPAGELWVEHEWTLIRRKQETPIGQQNLFAHIVEGPAATAAAAGSAFLGTTSGLLRAGSTIPSVLTSSTFTMPIAGSYLVAMQFTGSVTVVPSLSLGSAIVAFNLMKDSGASNVNSVSSSTTTLLFTTTVSSSGTGANNTVTLSGLTNLAAGTADIFIVQISGGATLASALKSGKCVKDDAILQALMERLSKIEQNLPFSTQLRVLPHHVVTNEPETPSDDEKELDIPKLERSVHISQSTAEQLLRGLGLKK